MGWMEVEKSKTEGSMVPVSEPRKAAFWGPEALFPLA